MSKLENMVEDVLADLQGFNQAVEIVGSLQANVTATATTFSMAGASYAGVGGFTTGILELGTELVYIQKIDPTTNTVQASIRGYRGTSAVAHPAGTLTRMNPRYARVDIARKINETIQSLYPRVFGVKTVEVTPNGFSRQYALPNEALTVLAVNGKDWDNSYYPIYDYQFSNLTDSKSITLFAGYEYNRPIRVSYKVQPKAITFGQDFTASSFPDFTEQVVKLGAEYRLTTFIEAGRFANNEQVQNAEQNFGAGLNNAKYFYQLFNQELQYVTANLKNQYPTRISRTYNRGF